MSIVYTLLSGKKLNEKEFCRYLYKKIDKTSKKLSLKFDLRGKNKVYCLDAAAIDIMYSLMAKNKAKVRKTVFLYCLKKELEIFSRLRDVKFQFIEYKGLKLGIKNMLDKLEAKHPEIKYSILKAHLQADSMS